VFLVDNGAKPVSANHDPAILAIALPDRLEDAPSALVWDASKHHRCNHMETAIAVLRIAAEQEYRRLLYVAMTRAADRLYVAAHGRATGLDDGSWYRLIETALAPEAEQVTDADGARLARRWRMAGAGHDAVPPVLNTGTAPAAPALTPDWLGKAVAESEAIEPLRPSKALAEMGEKDVREPFPAISLLDAAIAPESREARRGRAIHKLLEVLPDLEPSARASAGLGHVRRAMPDLNETEAEAVVGEALAVLDHPAFAAAFAAASSAFAAALAAASSAFAAALAAASSGSS
jgi:ATP-dependent helicase/nuclease subunit A